MNKADSVARLRNHDAGAQEPLDVLHLINGEYYAGAERVQELLAERLPSFGYRVRFVCLKQGQFQRALAQGSHDCFTVTMGSRLDVFSNARTIARHARQSGCRLIHSHTPRSALVGSLAAALAGLPMVHHVHSPTSRNTARRWLDPAIALVERAALVKCRKLIPVSESLADDLRSQGYPSARITVVPNGVAMNDRPVAGQRSGELTVGTVALFRPRKGIEVLLQALARLVHRGICVRLLAVGPFETAGYEQRVMRLSRDLGLEDWVIWRGFQRDVPAELERMDLVTLPSLFGEGMPMVVLEAMAMGLPVVASRVEGVPEVVRDGLDGLLVDPGDADGLADAIGRLAAEPEILAAMGRSGRQRQRDEFSDVAMAERLAHIYDQLLGLERPAPATTLRLEMGDAGLRSRT